MDTIRLLRQIDIETTKSTAKQLVCVSVLYHMNICIGHKHLLSSLQYEFLMQHYRIG